MFLTVSSWSPPGLLQQTLQDKDRLSYLLLQLTEDLSGAGLPRRSGAGWGLGLFWDRFSPSSTSGGGGAGARPAQGGQEAPSGSQWLPVAPPSGSQWLPVAPSLQGAVGNLGSRRWSGKRQGSV